MCIDNAEDLIDKSGEELKEFIKTCWEAMPNLNILVTSSYELGFFEESEVQETCYWVRPLKKK